MAVEAKRGCGYRKVGGLYLCGDYIGVPCDRMPFPVGHCPVCGQGIHFSRSYTEINPFRLFGLHDYSDRDERSGIFIQRCTDRIRPCFMCDPRDEVAFIMTVGEKYYTPESFTREAREMGISKRIPAMPRNMKLGETVVYLAHPKAVGVRESVPLQEALAIVEGGSQPQRRLLEAERVKYGLGIFCAFIPQRVEKLIWESEVTEKNLHALRERGITAVVIPDGDTDHR